MSDSPVLDGGARFPEVMTIRLPTGFLDRIRLAAEGEAIAPRDFVRRAVSERLIRIEGASPPMGQDPATASAQPTNPNISAARAAVNATTEAPASTPASTKRRDA